MYIIKDKKFFGELFKLSLPLAFTSLLSFSLTLSDNLMVSRLGEDATSAVYLGNQIFIVLQFIMSGIESTTLVLSSQSVGDGDDDKADKIFFVGLVTSFIVALLFTSVSVFAPSFIIKLLTNKPEVSGGAAEYLRISALSFIPFSCSSILSAREKSHRRVKIPFISATSALIFNLVLNYFLIFGSLFFPRLEIKGAAISTLISRLCELSILSAAFFINNGAKAVRLGRVCCGIKDAVFNFFKFGAPLILSQAIWCVNSFFSASVMGRQNDKGILAAVAAAAALYNLTYVFAAGLSGALGILTATDFGEKKLERIKKRRLSVQLVFLVIGIVTGIAMQAFKWPFLSLWGIGVEAEEFAIQFINILSVFVIGTVYQSAVLNGIIKSVGESRFVLYTEAFAVFVLIIPISLLFEKAALAPCLIFAALKCDQILKCPIALIKLYRTRV